MTLWLDLDGVFADFRKSFDSIVGFPYSDNPQLAWSKLDKVDNLFLNLDPLPGAEDFFNEIYHTAKCKVAILTALPLLTGKLITAPQDKRAWVRRFLDDEIPVICTDGWGDKKNFCTHGDVLVDDMERNIIDWNAAGGIGVHHLNQETTLKRLKDLEIIC